MLVATLHLGNWELLAATLCAHGIDFAAVGARPKSSPLHRWLNTTREALGVKVLAPGGGARTVGKRLADGGVAALFVDQSTRERSRPIAFFHEMAPTPTTYERLLKLTDAVPILVWTTRGGDGVHRIYAEDVPLFSASAESRTGEAPLNWITARAEDLIRAEPAQWVWIHDRWDTVRRDRKQSSRDAPVRGGT